MTDQRLPFDEVERTCLTCGRIVLQAKKRRGRYTEFCSAGCRAVAYRQWRVTEQVKTLSATAGLKVIKAGGGSKVRKGQGPGPVGAFAYKTCELNTKSHIEIIQAPIVRITCVACGNPFDLERIGRGRLPRLCSAECRQSRKVEQKLASLARLTSRSRAKSPEG